MNSTSTAYTPTTQTLRDVVPVKPKPAPPVTPAAQVAPEVNSKPEIIDNIPVRIQSGSDNLAMNTVPKINPIAAEPKQFAESEKEDKELEQVLKDVSSSVKGSEAPPTQPKSKKLKSLGKNTKQKDSNNLQPRGNSSPVVVTAAALVVASGLIISALIIFSRG